VLGLPFRERAWSGDAGGGLAATEMGDAVHRLLELVPLDDPAPPPRTELERAVQGWYPEATPEELDRIAAMVDAYCRSDLAQRIAGLRGARPERPFTFEHDGVVIRGRLDVLWRDGARAVVVDYKSNALEGRAPAEIIEAEYSLQRLVYALVCLRAGVDEVEVAYQFLERPDDVVSTTFTVEDAPTLESDLSAAIARIREGDFRPTPSEFACSDCPALDLLCAGPRLGLSR
jgi:ATP-dependent helicase/nuclease subunit A